MFTLTWRGSKTFEEQSEIVIPSRYVKITPGDARAKLGGIQRTSFYKKHVV